MLSIKAHVIDQFDLTATTFGLTELLLVTVNNFLPEGTTSIIPPIPPPLLPTTPTTPFLFVWVATLQLVCCVLLLSFLLLSLCFVFQKR